MEFEKLLDFTALVIMRTQNTSLDNIFSQIKPHDTNSNFACVFLAEKRRDKGGLVTHSLTPSVPPRPYNDNDDNDDADEINVSSKDAFRVCSGRTSSRLCRSLFV